jgi:hypothetical protein
MVIHGVISILARSGDERRRGGMMKQHGMTIKGLLALAVFAVPVMGAACTAPVDSEGAGDVDEEEAVGVAQEEAVGVGNCRSLGGTQMTAAFDDGSTCADDAFGDLLGAAIEFCSGQPGALQGVVKYYTGPDIDLATTCSDYTDRDARYWTAYWGCCDSGACAHPVCQLGAGLNPACDPCVAQICAFDPLCCTGVWRPACVSYVNLICGSFICE